MSHTEHLSCALAQKKEQWAKIVHQISILTPEMHRAHQEIEDFARASQNSDQSAIMILEAAPLAGATHLIEEYRKKANDQRLGSAIVTDYLSLASVSTPKEMLNRALKNHGMPEGNHTTINQIGRYIRMLKASRTNIIFFDHIDLTFLRGKDLSRNLDFLNAIITGANLVAVFITRDRFANVISAHPTFCRYIRQWHTYSSYRWDVKAEREEFRKLLLVLNDALPFKRRSSFSSPAMALKIHKATAGSVGQVMPLIKYAALSSIYSGCSAISAAHIANACKHLNIGTEVQWVDEGPIKRLMSKFLAWLKFWKKEKPNGKPMTSPTVQRSTDSFI